MKTEDLIKLEFGRLRAYIGNRDILAPVKNDLVRTDIYQTLYERAIQTDYNISAYILDEEFNKLRNQYHINFPRTANKQEAKQ